MATRKAKFSISIEKLQIEFEGSQEVGQQIQYGVQQALGGLMNTQARLLALREEVSPVGDVQVVEAPAPNGTQANGQGAAANGNGAHPGDANKTKQPRQRRTSGVSLKGLLRGLKTDGFFGQARSRADTEARLKDKGHTFKASHVSARLMELAQKDELYRKLGGDDGNYVYKDSPFDESSGSPHAAEQSA